ncbi:tetratricopeptide repeat protein [Kutzneria sp. NPDC051319]|uniref:tetratricopeptide repeat protein n=1 Tax=Kutzneria sp. NPDC051319 TaxID=3155047 RepID=UPI00344821C8
MADELPDPGLARTLDDLVDGLRRLKVWAGDPSYERITARVNAAWREDGRPEGELAGKTTVVDCFRSGRRRLNTDLVTAVVRALNPDVGYEAQWRQALRVVGGEARAAAQVRVHAELPPDLADFVGRGPEVRRLRQVLAESRRTGDAVVISAIEGMAGIGKTELAVRVGHLMARDKPFDQVLFVDLRGFDPDQPPADPAAVLDGFLRLLGVPGHKIGNGLAARAAAYRERLAGAEALVILDNAADREQIEPLLPGTAGCLTLVTSRRRLDGVAAVTNVVLDPFTSDEAVTFLGRMLPDVPVGADPTAAARIAERCGGLPLALDLIAGHIRATPGWTLTDHAERLDERHRTRRIDGGVELAFSLSYQRLPADLRRLLRLAALHPGPELDVHAAAALADIEPSAAQAGLDHLHRDHLLHRDASARYTCHDLVRSYAAARAADEDPPAERRAAQTRLFNHYLGAAALAVNTLFPADALRRPDAPATHLSALNAPDAARAWLDAERPNLVAVASHTADHGWPSHTLRFSTILWRYFIHGYPADALIVHGHAYRTARNSDDPAARAQATMELAAAHLQLSNLEQAVDLLDQVLPLLRQTGDVAGQARALTNLGVADTRLCRYKAAAEHYERAATLFRQVGDKVGEARVLNNLGAVEERLGQHESAVEHLRHALALSREFGDRDDEAWALTGLASVEVRAGHGADAGRHFEQSLAIFRELGDRDGEAWAVEGTGALHASRGEPAQAAEHFRRALTIFREVEDRDGEAYALNGLGETLDDVTHHAEALIVATEISAPDQQARAHAGLGRGLKSREHLERALALYAELESPAAEDIRRLLET